MKNIASSSLKLASVLASGFLLAGCIGNNTSSAPSPTPSAATSAESSPAAVTNTMPAPDASGLPKVEEMVVVQDGEVKIFDVVGGDFSFDVKEIRVKKGDKVKIVFENQEGFHDWVIDEFNARTPQIKAGKTEEVEFVADKVGTFEYYCSVGKHRQNGMKGKLIVE